MPLPLCTLLAAAVQEKPQGAVPEAWLAALAASGLATTDMAADLAQLLSPKDDEEAKNVKKAAYLVGNALVKFTVPQLEGAWPRPAGAWAGRAGGQSRPPLLGSCCIPSPAELLAACRSTVFSQSGCLRSSGPPFTVIPPLLPPFLPGIIDEEKKVRHSKLADKIEEVISEPSKMDIKLKVGGAAAARTAAAALFIVSHCDPH